MMNKSRNNNKGAKKLSTERSKTGRSKLSHGVNMHHDMATATELSRNALSREKYQLILKVIMGLICILFVQMIIVGYLAMRPVEQRYFTTDPQGNIKPLTALEKPMPATDQVLNWAATAVTRGYTMSFGDYEQRFADIRSNFTDDGWKSFENALTRAGFIELLIKNKLVSTAVVTEAPIIVAQGLVGNAYGWRIQIPITITFQSANYKDSKSSLVEVTVVRVPETQNPSGLGIAQILSK